MTEVNECRKCNLWKTRRKPVPGDGDVNASIVFIGEAPGYWEDVRGKPFVGAAGKLLDNVFEKVGISRSKVYITNVVKCRPPGNRDPRLEEIEACSPYLDRQLNIIKPKIIVTLGRHSTSYIFSKIGLKFKSMRESQGRVYKVNLWDAKTYVAVSYHPAAALYNVKLKEKIEKTMRMVKELEETMLI
ncbi:MAG TPA: uracil-DNA glycosylase [Candidatus Bathyarchaeota archaeon]|nr:uracil-DNA glycosylase [Candidatus Bathyarchaeota archaeon]